jgi:oligoendopeptidase F
MRKVPVPATAAPIFSGCIHCNRLRSGGKIIFCRDSCVAHLAWRQKTDKIAGKPLGRHAVRRGTIVHWEYDISAWAGTGRGAIDRVTHGSSTAAPDPGMSTRRLVPGAVIQGRELMQDPYIKERERSRIPEKYTWDLTDIYPDDEAWETAREQLKTEFQRIPSFSGKLSESPGRLIECLEFVNLLEKEYTRLACYAGMKSDLDTREARYLSMDQEMSQIGSNLSSFCAFIKPEILKIGADTISDFIRREPRLEIYRHVFDDILRKKDHTRTESEEAILAEAGLMADAPGTIYSIFSNADFPYPEVTLDDGSTVRLDPAAFSLHRRSAVRENRKKIFAAYLGKIDDFRRTFGAQLAAEVRKNMFYARTRSYSSCLERALDTYNVPVTVYTSLISGVRSHLDTLHRSLGLRRRLLGLDELHYYDLYAPVVKDLDQNYTYDEAVGHVLASLTPLGEDYGTIAGQALTNRWIDVYHNNGKRSGAYSNGAVYDIHPYILLNFNGKYDDISTLAHELGHTMHSWMSNKKQPYVLSHYSIFVAEVASTFNEALLLNHMLAHEKRDEVRLSLLVNYLDNARATVFRQVQFAEFELVIHELMDKGTALTGDLLNSRYLALVREYYGHEKGICVIDDDIQAEWAYIPHFFYNFYVYQYATSFTASAALSERALAGDDSVIPAYLDLLSAGGSDYPISLLKTAGVDLTTPEPLDAVMAKMNRVMDEIERISGSR